LPWLTIVGSARQRAQQSVGLGVFPEIQ
jgi:hypothetical protein